MVLNSTTPMVSPIFNSTHLQQATSGTIPRSLEELNYLFDNLASNFDNFYTLTYGIMILLMTMGFAFVEAGCVRSKNTHNILLKNYLDAFVAGISYWTIGYALAYGEGNSFVGWTHFASSYMENDQMANYFYQVMFASTACTIVSGSLAERCNFHAYLIYSFFLTALVYPFCTRWGWSSYGYLHIGHTFEIEDGKTAHIKYEDFGGSGVVHLTGGTAGLVGAIILGPRIGRFHEKTGAVLPIRGHSLPLAVMGIFVLFFGFMAFNAASQGHISQPGDGGAISMAVFNTVICASMGGMTALFTNKIGLFGHHWSMPQVINGCFAAMVASCGPCNSMKPWGAVIVGFVAAMVMNCVEILMFKLKIDDPLNAVGVHFGGGMWGAISVAFVKYPTGILMAWDRQAGARLAWQLSGVLTYFAWTALCMTIVFGSLRLLGLFRVPRDVEIKGLDLTKHGQPAYPIEAYGHGYTEKILGLSSNGQLTQIEQGFVESDVFVRDQGPYEHQEAKVMGIHKVKTVSTVLELNNMSPSRPASKQELHVEEVTASGSHSNLSNSSQVAIIGAHKNWTLGPVDNQGHVNNGFDHSGENGIRTVMFERTAL